MVDVTIDIYMCTYVYNRYQNEAEYCMQLNLCFNLFQPKTVYIKIKIEILGHLAVVAKVP